MSIVNMLHDRGLVIAPKNVKDHIEYEAVIGSISYGVSTDTSDTDIIGICIPDRHVIFPYEAGFIYGFESPEIFEQWQKHHIKDLDNNKEYDLTIFNIIKYFRLCMECNPNMIDSLFVPQRCVLTCSNVGNMIRERKNLFLSKLSWNKFQRYAQSQLNKMREKHIWAKKLFEFEKENNLIGEFNIYNHRDLISVISLYAKIEHNESIVFIDSSKTQKFATYGDLCDKLLLNQNIMCTLHEWFVDNLDRRISLDKESVKYQYVDIDSIGFNTHHDLTKKQKLKFMVIPSELSNNDILILKDVYNNRDHKIIKHLNDKSKLYEYCNILCQFGHYSTKRMDNVRKFGFDPKFGYHLVRLLGEVDQILTSGELTLDDQTRVEKLKAIRCGEWMFDDFADYFEKHSNRLYVIYKNTSIIPSKPRVDEIKELLIDCLEERFGDLSMKVRISDSTKVLIDKIDSLLYEFRR